MRRLSSLLVALVLCAAAPLEAAVAFTTSSNKFVAAAVGTSVTVASVPISATANRGLFCGIRYVTPAGVTVTDAKFNTSETLSASHAAYAVGNRRLYFFHLTTPTNTTASVVFTLSASTVASVFAACAEFTGIDTTTPVPDYAEATASSTALSVTAPNVTSGDMVLDLASCDGCTTLTIGANQLQVAKDETNDPGAMSYQLGADGGVMTWTANISGAWEIATIRIAQNGGGGGGGSTAHHLTTTGAGK